MHCCLILKWFLCSWEMDSLIPVGSFQLTIFCDARGEATSIARVKNHKTAVSLNTCKMSSHKINLYISILNELFYRTLTVR